MGNIIFNKMRTYCIARAAILMPEAIVLAIT